MLRLSGGEDLDTLAREVGVTAARLSQWRDDSLASGEAELESRESNAHDVEIARLNEKVGELTMSLEASHEAVNRLQGDGEGPLDRRKSKS